jgi:hypothetical protein
MITVIGGMHFGCDQHSQHASPPQHGPPQSGIVFGMATSASSPAGIGGIASDQHSQHLSPPQFMSSSC